MPCSPLVFALNTRRVSRGQEMVKQHRGLLVNLSYRAAQKRTGNATYDAAKAVTDKMQSDMGDELRANGVAAVSLYPGLVGTEKVMAAAQRLDLSNSESPFAGRAVVVLATDPDVLRQSRHVWSGISHGSTGSRT